MNDQARKKLFDFISNYGPTICTTPRTCVMILGQQCAEFPSERDLLLKALEGGTVTELIKAPVGGPWDEQVKRLAGSGISTDDAHWAVESWAIALGKHPHAAPPPPVPAVSMNAPPGMEKGSVVRATGTTMAVAIGGGIGGAFFPAMTLFMVLTMMLISSPSFEAGIPPLKANLNILIVSLIGGAGGALGAAAGWTIIQIQSGPLALTAEESNRRMRKGFIGALGGAMTGSVLGCIRFRIIGVFLSFFWGRFWAAWAGPSPAA